MLVHSLTTMVHRLARKFMRVITSIETLNQLNQPLPDEPPIESGHSVKIARMFGLALYAVIILDSVMYIRNKPTTIPVRRKGRSIERHCHRPSLKVAHTRIGCLNNLRPCMARARGTLTVSTTNTANCGLRTYVTNVHDNPHVATTSIQIFTLCAMREQVPWLAATAAMLAALPAPREKSAASVSPT